MEHFTKESLVKEKEEALNSDDEMPAETEDSPDTHESGDDDDYEIISLHEDEETNAETNIPSIVSVENGVREQSVRAQTGKDQARKASIPAHETEDQAVPNVTEGANGVDRLSTFDEDFKEDIEMWSDIEAELTNEGIGSDEERALLDADDELAAQNSSAAPNETASEDIMCGGDCPLKKARLEEEKEAAATTGI
jgi:hypothetical protein